MDTLLLLVLLRYFLFASIGALEMIDATGGWVYRESVPLG
jgi:hypothetical protein